MPQLASFCQIRVFIVVWFGQVVSLLGSGLTNFALGVWVYEKTGSVTQFALISLFIALPTILISPVAGALADRWNRRQVMILGDFGAGLTTLAVAMLLAFGHLDIWQIYLLTAISATFNAFQRPAYISAIALLVPKQFLGRASGMTQLGEALAQLLAPMLAGVLLATIQLRGIILLDFSTFLIALITLLFIRFPASKNTKPQAVGGSLIQEAVYGWTYLKARPGLFGLMTLFTAANFLVGAVSVLVTPLVLSFASSAVLGTIMTIGGIGMVIGSVVISTWGGPNRQINSVFGFMLLSGLCLVAAGMRTSVAILAVAAFLFFLSLPIIRVSSQVIFQKKVAHDVQGRVFALNGALASASMPFAYLVAGPLADQIFEPLMAENGPLADSIGRLIGVGEGRGIGLMFIVIGILLALLTVFGYQYRRLRRVEDELPDAVADEAVVLEP